MKQRLFFVCLFDSENQKKMHAFMFVKVWCLKRDDNDGDDSLVFYVPLNIIQVIKMMRDNGRLCAMKHQTVMSWNLLPAGFKPGTLQS